mmetsp:Transcript_55144/g.167627  ORF Transcript_55144/g.167627 Transcript_55144/m.167627 type:complete len:338 (-) Transcript_55144:658-1671(-)
MQAEDLGALEAHDEALQLLHVRGEASCFDAQHVAATIRQHVLHLRVPCNAVRIGLLVQQRLRVQVVYKQIRRFVNHGQFLSPARQIQTPHRSGLLDERHRERIVDEDLHDVAIFQADEETFPSRSSADDLDIPDKRVKVPLPFQHALEGIQLQFPFLTQDDVVRRDDQQRAHELLLDLLDVLVVHIQRVVVGHFVNQHLVGKLYCQPVAIHRNLLDIILASDTHLLLRDEVLNDDVGHDIPVGVAVLVQAMDSREDDLVHHDSPIIATDDHVVLPRPHGHRPNPVLPFAEIAQEDAFPAPQLHLLVAPAQHEIVAVGKEIDAARVEVQTMLPAIFLP